MVRPRAREFGIKLGSMTPGKLNAITDVEGVGVGHSTLLKGNSIRTGVTAIVPHDSNTVEKKVVAAVDLFNAYGKSTGLPQIMFEGVLESPILLTETMNTWRVADALVDYFMEKIEFYPRTLNVVVGETNGSYLTNNLERPIGKKHVYEALDIARSSLGRGKVQEGNVGGGTPMMGYGFKGGIGTSSREGNGFTVGVLVQLNCGNKDDLIIGGIPVGKELNFIETPDFKKGNSIMMVVATDLAMDSRQLWKVAKRAALGLARTGSYGGNSSGDFTIAFTTSTKEHEKDLDDSFLNPVYKATVESTEEAIINALFAAETLNGVNNHVAHEIPLDQLKIIFNKLYRSNS